MFVLLAPAEQALRISNIMLSLSRLVAILASLPSALRPLEPRKSIKYYDILWDGCLINLSKIASGSFAGVL